MTLHCIWRYAIHKGCKSAKADQRQTALTSRGEGNPMTDNARHIPGSTRSCRTPLSRSATPPRRFQNLGKSTYKIQTKFRQNRECDFSNHSASTTYNFNALKCLNFSGGLPVSTVESQSLGTESHDARPQKSVDCYSFSLGEKVRMRDKPVNSLRPPPSHGNKLATTVHNGTKWDGFTFLQKPTTLYQRLTTTLSPVVPFCSEQLPAVKQMTTKPTEDRRQLPFSLGAAETKSLGRSTIQAMVRMRDRPVIPSRPWEGQSQILNPKSKIADRPALTFFASIPHLVTSNAHEY